MAGLLIFSIVGASSHVTLFLYGLRVFIEINSHYPVGGGGCD